MFKLLIVEDDYISLEGIIRVMPWQELGITRIEKADDGVNALEIAQEFRPHIVISDIRMPRMDGMVFATRIREIEPACKLIFMSAYSEKEYYKCAIKLKAVSFVEKPIDVDELKAAIESAVALCNEDRERITRSNEINYALQRNYKNELVMLLMGREAESAKIKQKLEQIPLSLPEEPYFTTAIIRINKASDDVDYSDRDVRENLLRRVDLVIRENSIQGISAFKDNQNIIIHLFYPPDKKNLLSRDSLESLCCSIYEAVKSDCGVSVAVGKVTHDLNNTYESYASAVLALQETFFLTGRPVKCYTESQRQPYLLESSQIQNFSELLVKKDQYGAVFFVKQLSCNLRSYPNTLVNRVKDFYFKLLLQLMKSSEEEGIQLMDTEKSENYLWNMVTNFCFLTELENYVIQKIDTYFGLQQEKNRYGSTVSEILNYIQENYHDQNLSIKDISERIGLSAAYLCVLFKEETGETINHYITKYRIEKSKAHLKNKSLNVAEVARKVGYLEGSYFAKLFRKIEGVSPSEYQNRV